MHQPQNKNVLRLRFLPVDCFCSTAQVVDQKKPELFNNDDDDDDESVTLDHD